MISKNFKRLVACASMIVAFSYAAGCSVDYPSTSGTSLSRITNSGDADFSKFVVVGNSLTAGFQSGGMAKTFQMNSYGAIIARQLGMDSAGSMGSEFEQPLFADPGTPGTLTLCVTSSGPSPTGVTGALSNPLNLALARPYDNVAVPGSFVWDFMNATGSSNATSWSQTRFGSQNALFDPILRGLGTQFQQVRALSPTFVIWWEGHNDILGYATSGAGIRGNFQAAAVAGYTPVNSSDPLFGTFGYNFADGFNASMDSLATIGADVITGNIPYVTDIPYFTTIFPSSSVPDTNGHPWYLITNPSTGAKTRLYYQEATTPDSIVYLLLPVSSLFGSLSASIGDLNPATPYGLHPLDPIQGKYTLTIAEVASIKNIIDSYNASIAAAAAEHGYPVLDVKAIFSEVKAVSGSAGPGYSIGSGIKVKADFISGGLFSLDGVHPSALGYAFVANEYIKAINEHYGSNIPLVNFNSFLNPQ
jgi:hypothetical protein